MRRNTTGLSRWAAEPEGSLKSRFAHRFIGTDEKGYTHVHVEPLDIDLSDRHAAALRWGP